VDGKVKVTREGVLIPEELFREMMSAYVKMEQVLATLEKVAEKENITYQIKQPLGGGTDGGPISQTRHGVPTGVVSVPCRYIHSAISLLQLRDIMATIDLVYGFTQTWKP